jgi:hypothetical protein
MTEQEIVAFVEKAVADALAKIPSEVQVVEQAAEKVYAKAKAEVKTLVKLAGKVVGAFGAGGVGAYVVPAIVKVIFG